AACRIAPSYADAWLFKGLKKLLVTGYGATLKVFGNGLAFFGGDGLNDTNGVAAHCALVATVGTGSKSVTVLTPSNASVLTVGNYAIVMGYDMQGTWNSGYGYPPNPAFHDFVKVTDIDTGTGVVTFDIPLNYDYKSTWPKVSLDPGPASICPLPANWDIDFEFRGFTFTQGGGDLGTKAEGRNITWRDVTFTG